MQSLTAEDLAGARRSTAAAGSDARTQQGSRGRRSRRRGVRRTDSGRSVKTLPEYSKEAGDEELVLVRYVLHPHSSLIPILALLTDQEAKRVHVG